MFLCQMLGGSRSFGTHISENHLGISFAFSLVGHGTKWAREAAIWPKMTKMPILTSFWAQNPIFFGRKQNFFNPYIGEPIRHLFCVEKIDLQGPNGPLGTKICKMAKNFINMANNCCSMHGNLSAGNRLFSENPYLAPLWDSVCR